MILTDWPMPIFTEHLIIKPPEIGEGALLNEAIIETYEELKSTVVWAKTPPSLRESERFVRQAAANWILKNNQEPYLPLFIFDKKTNTFLGASGYHHLNWAVPCLETGYWLRKTAQKKGIMTQALNAVTRYAFLVLKAKRVEIRCDINNMASKRIPQRLGYSLEAVLKQHRIDPQTQQISDTALYVRHDIKQLPPLDVHWAGVKERNKD